MEVTYLVVLILIFVLGIAHIRNNGGITEHIYFSYALAVYFLFFPIPGYFYWKLETFEELGINIKSVFTNGLRYYSIGMFCFVLGYILKPSNVHLKPIVKLGSPLNDKILIRITLFFIFITGGMFFGIAHLNGYYLIYVWSTLDCLITLIIAMYIRKVKKSSFLILTGLTVFIFSIYFFRYRIYLTIMGIGAVYLYHNPDILKKIWKYIFLGASMIYIVLFFTINRNTLADLQFDQVEYNVFNSSGGASIQNIFIQQASNLHADFTVLKYYQENREAPHDHGVTMFLYPFIRAIPSFLFANNTKPYPAPAMQLIINAYGGDLRAEGAGRFVTNLFEFYIAFGLIGLIGGMFTFGLILRYLQDKWYWDGSYNSIIQIAIMVSLFQYISRGYFPQYLNHLVYLIAPVALLRRLSRRTNTIENDRNNLPNSQDQNASHVWKT